MSNFYGSKDAKIDQKLLKNGEIYASFPLHFRFIFTLFCEFFKNRVILLCDQIEQKVQKCAKIAFTLHFFEA